MLWWLCVYSSASDRTYPPRISDPSFPPLRTVADRDINLATRTSTPSPYFWATGLLHSLASPRLAMWMDGYQLTFIFRRDAVYSTCTVSMFGYMNACSLRFFFSFLLSLASPHLVLSSFLAAPLRHASVCLLLVSIVHRLTACSRTRTCDWLPPTNPPASQPLFSFSHLFSSLPGDSVRCHLFLGTWLKLSFPFQQPPLLFSSLVSLVCLVLFCLSGGLGALHCYPRDSMPWHWRSILLAISDSLYDTSTVQYSISAILYC